MSLQSIEIARKMLKLNNQDIGRVASGGYGADRQREFLRDLNKILEELAGATRPFHAA